MARLLVIGALALDRPVRLSAAPAGGARLHGRSLGGRLAGRLGGGGANAAAAWRKAGHEALLASVIAEDADADHALTLMAEAGVDVSLVRRRPGASSTTLILVDPEGERTVISVDADRTAVGQVRAAGPEELAGPPPDGVFIRAAYPGAEAWARAGRGPVVLHWPSHGYAGEADVLVASADDLDAAFLAEPFAAGRAAIAGRLTWVVITRGAAGATAYGATGEVFAEAPRACMRDATGAGDVFAAGLLDALAAGAPMGEALAHACAWGSAAVELESSAPVDAPAGALRAYASFLRSSRETASSAATATI